MPGKPSSSKAPLSVREFAELGTPRLVYIRPIVLPDGSRNFSIHAANGMPLGLAPDYVRALAQARSHELEPVSLH